MIYDNPNITLIEPHEVRMFAPTDAHDDSASRCEYIIMKEEKLFRECLGMPWYHDLIKEKIRYPEGTYEEFDESKPYKVGDIVLEKGMLYECIMDTEDESPGNTKFWKPAPKFNNDKYQYVWSRYLKFIIAFYVVHTSTVTHAIRQTAIGLQRKNSKNSRAANLQEIYAYKKDVLLDAKDHLINMDNFIKEHPECFPLYAVEDCKTDGCVTIKRKRHYGFNTGGSEYAYEDI